jgi:hypothetical protein
MGLASQIKNGSWGALGIYIYTLFVLLYWDTPLITSDRMALAAASIPALSVMFLVVVFNHQLNKYWAGGNLRQSAEEINQITGENDFYHSASQDIRDTIDDFDEKAYGHHVAILSGITLSILTPITGYLAFHLTGFAGGLIAALASLWGLSIRSYRELNRLAEDLSTPYVENYENQ